jgi:hypothetical protein
VPTKRYWTATSLLSLAIATAGTLELMVRRDTGVSLYLVNKAVASTAFLMITASYVLSAIHRFRGPFSGLLPYRRYAGLVGYGYAVAHLILVLVLHDPESPGTLKFPFPDFFIANSIAILLAVTGFAIFSHTFKLSFEPAKRHGTPEKACTWRSMLRYGYFGVLFVFVHAALLKYDGWLQWLATRTPRLPPLSLIVALLGLGMIVLKIAQLTKERRLL